MSENLNQAKSAEKAEEDKNFKSIYDRIKMRRFQFALKCLRKSLHFEENMVLCPHSLYNGLLIIYLAINGDIEMCLRQILDLADFTKSELIDYVWYITKKKVQLDKYAKKSSSYYKDYCFCWVKKDTEYFENLEKSYPFTWSARINFVNSTHRKINIINKYMKLYTKNICNPVQLNEDSKDMEFILTNIFCFNNKRFEGISTACHPDAPTVSTFLNKQKRKSFFAPEFEMHVSEFSYESSDTSLYVLIPASSVENKWTVKDDINTTDILKLVHRLYTTENACKLRNLLHNNTTSEDDIDLSTWPTFEVENNVNIRELLKALDAEQLFMPGAIYLGSRSRENNEHVAKAVHRARVKVTKENTVGGGINVFCTDQVSLPSTDIVGVNYNFPFVWFIYGKEIEEIFFIGSFNIEPESNL